MFLSMLPFISILASALFMPKFAYAYLDPAAGSMLIQLLIGGIAVAGVTINLYWTKLKSFFRKKSNDDIELK